MVQLKQDLVGDLVDVGRDEVILQHLLRREELQAEVASEPVPLLVDSVDMILQVAFLRRERKKK